MKWKHEAKQAVKPFADKPIFLHVLFFTSSYLLFLSEDKVSINLLIYQAICALL
jgi:hypothetical protein